MVEDTRPEAIETKEGAKVYTLEEVSKHSTEKDCWLVIGGKVYDVTEYLEEHPGGDEVLLSSTGKDATDDFEDVGHSESARKQLAKYYVGEYDASSEIGATTGVKTGAAVSRSKSSSTILTSILQVLVPVAILALAVAVRYYTKKEPLAKS